MAPAFPIRRAARHEASAIEALCIAAYAEYRTQVPMKVSDAYFDGLRRLGERWDEAVTLVAEVDGGIAGSVLFYADATAESRALPPEWARFGTLAVRPNMRRRGIGRALVEACVLEASRIGAPAIGLHTAPFMKVAGRIYGRIGFRRCPRHDLTASAMLGIDGGPDAIEVIAYRLDLAST